MVEKFVKYAIVVVLAAGIVLTAFNYAGSSQKPEGAPEASDFSAFTAELLSGGTFSSDDLHGHKVNLVNVWATYCAPCIREMPDLEVISKDYVGDVQVIGICIDTADPSGTVDDAGVELAKNIADEVTKISYPVLIPSEGLLRGVLADVTAVPVSFILNDTGQILESFVGSRRESELREKIEVYLK